MTEITRTILSALARAEDGPAIRLPVDPRILPLESVVTADAEFAELCRVRLESEDEAQPVLSIQVGHRSPGPRRELIGEVLNFILGHATRNHIEKEPAR